VYSDVDDLSLIGHAGQLRQQGVQMKTRAGIRFLNEGSKQGGGVELIFSAALSNQQNRRKGVQIPDVSPYNGLG
jgi:hypothetical protein